MFNKQHVVIDVGNKTIKIVIGNINKGKINVLEYAIVDTPINTIKDGKITNLKTLSAIIAETLKQTGIRGKKLVLNITGTGVITREIQIPKSTDQEIESMLEFEAQQYFPVDLENYVLDFKVLEEFENGDSSFSHVLLVAVPVKQVDEYMKISGLLKMEIAAIDLPANCISKLLFFQDDPGGGSEKKQSEAPTEFAVVDIGSDTTSVCIFSGGKLKFNRILLNGSGDLDVLISNFFSIDFQQAERKKIEIGHLSQEETEGDTVSEVIKPAINNIISDISRFLEFYNSRGTGNKLDKIYLCGGGSRLKGLSQYMESYLNIPVESLEVCRNVTYTGKKDKRKFEEEFAFLANGIGGLVRV